MILMQYSFSGRFDLVKFVRTVQAAGMYLMLRIGPFVAAEWNFGLMSCVLFYFVAVGLDLCCR